MKTFKIAVEWSSYGVISVEAENLEEAIKYAHDNIDELPIPEEWEYLEDSYQINDDKDLLEYLNK